MEGQDRKEWKFICVRVCTKQVSESACTSEEAYKERGFWVLNRWGEFINSTVLRCDVNYAGGVREIFTLVKGSLQRATADSPTERLLLLISCTGIYLMRDF